MASNISSEAAKPIKEVKERKKTTVCKCREPTSGTDPAKETGGCKDIEDYFKPKESVSVTKKSMGIQNKKEVTDYKTCPKCEKPVSMVKRKCRKCARPPSVVLRVKDLYCKECFVSATVHKFRSSLGKMKVRGGRMLVAHSGGISSLVLLHLLKDWLKACAKGGPRAEIHVLHVDECGALGTTSDECEANLKSLGQQLRSFEFPVFLSSLEMSLEGPKLAPLAWDVAQDEVPHVPVCCERDRKLKEIFQSELSLTRKEDLLERLRMRLINLVAEQLNCSTVLLGSTGSEVAVQILSNLVQGRITHISLETAASSKWAQPEPSCQKLLLRPLRDVTQKEVNLLAHFEDLQPISRISLSTGLEDEASIHRLTECFIRGLMKEFPSTEYAVLGTGSKLEGQDGATATAWCALCQGPLTTQEATISGTVIETKDGDKETLKLCYGCRHTVDEMPTEESKAAVIVKRSASSLVDSFKDCLL